MQHITVNVNELNQETETNFVKSFIFENEDWLTDAEYININLILSTEAVELFRWKKKHPFRTAY